MPIKLSGGGAIAICGGVSSITTIQQNSLTNRIRGGNQLYSYISFHPPPPSHSPATTDRRAFAFVPTIGIFFIRASVSNTHYPVSARFLSGFNLFFAKKKM